MLFLAHAFAPRQPSSPPGLFNINILSLQPFPDRNVKLYNKSYKFAGTDGKASEHAFHICNKYKVRVALLSKFYLGLFDIFVEN
jgi:hypothetical protein